MERPRLVAGLSVRFHGGVSCTRAGGNFQNKVDELNDTRILILVARDSIAPHGDVNSAVFALTKTTDADGIERMFDAH